VYVLWSLAVCKICSSEILRTVVPIEVVQEQRRLEGTSTEMVETASSKGQDERLRPSGKKEK
jgi:hypothetical protein